MSLLSQIVVNNKCLCPSHPVQGLNKVPSLKQTRVLLKLRQKKQSYVKLCAYLRKYSVVLAVYHHAGNLTAKENMRKMPNIIEYKFRGKDASAATTKSKSSSSPSLYNSKSFQKSPSKASSSNINTNKSDSRIIEKCTTKNTTNSINNIGSIINKENTTTTNTNTNTNTNTRNIKGSIIGAMTLIAGSTVGAGMLAIPATTAGSGFLPSASVMITCWVILTVEALLFAEVNLSIAKKKKLNGQDINDAISLTEMAQETLGDTGTTLTSILYLIVSYTLTMAFVSKGGGLINQISQDFIPTSLSGLAFVSSMGFFIYKSSTESIDIFNRVIVGGVLALFGVLLLGGSTNAQWDSLIFQQDWSQASSSMPVIFLSLVYHNIIPNICHYLNFDRKKICTSLILGSLIPLTMFMSWDAVTLANVPGALDVFKEGGFIDPLQVLIESKGGLISSCVSLFSMLTIMTSFTGSTLGLSEHMKSEVRKFKKGFTSKINELMYKNMTSEELSKEQESIELLDHEKIDVNLMAMVLSLAPPTLMASLASPDLFFAATHFAGAYGMTLLFGIFPPLMAWFNRHPHQNVKSIKKKHMVPGGRPVLASLATFIVCFEIGKIVEDSRFFISELSSTVGNVAATSTANLAVPDLAALPDLVNQIAQNLN